MPAIAEAPAKIEYIDAPQDALPAEVLKPHSAEKHAIVERYVDICNSVRGRWVNERGKRATYVACTVALAGRATQVASDFATPDHLSLGRRADSRRAANLTRSRTSSSGTTAKT